jgi:UPF0755 protein
VSPFGRRDDARRARTEADREAARREREALRAAREGRPVPPPPASDPAGPEGAAPAPSPTPEEHGAGDLAPYEAPYDAGEPLGEPGAEEELVAPEDPARTPAPPSTFRDWRAAVGEPDPDPPLVRRVPPGSEPTVEPPPDDPFTRAAEPAAPPPRIPPPPAPYAPGERPIGTRRVSMAQRLPALRRHEHPPARPPAPRRPRRPLRALALLLPIALAAVAIWFLASLFQPFHGGGSGSVSVRIPQGATAGQVGDLLEQRGVVSSSFFFSLRARVSGKRGDLKAGTFRLKHDMSYAAALDALTANPPAPPTIRVTIPEGRSRGEVASIVKQAGVKGDYAAASGQTTALRPRTYGAPKGTRSLEGFLFPATYELKPTQNASVLVSEQLAAFRQNIAKVSLAKARRKHLTTYDVLTIASMIEREAAVSRDRRLIAAVIYNRLKQGMPLGIDATIRYGLHNWTRPLRVSELNSPSPYNTRKRTGLPPTPIGNPGLASIQAAANPANVPYLFYVVKPCGRGAHAFSATDAQFQQDVAAYNRARAKAGGKSPVTC